MAAIDCMQDLFGFSLLPGLPASGIRHYLGNETADLLGVPKADWTRVSSSSWIGPTPLRSRRGAHPRDGADRVELGRRMLRGFEQYGRDGERPGFEITDELKEAWGMLVSRPRRAVPATVEAPRALPSIAGAAGGATLRVSGGRRTVTTENVACCSPTWWGRRSWPSACTPDAADEVRREHFAILRQALAEAGGTEVKHLGDGLMAVFASASAALACASRCSRGSSETTAAASTPSAPRRAERRRSHERGRRLLRRPRHRSGPALRDLRARADPRGRRRARSWRAGAAVIECRPVGELH